MSYLLAIDIGNTNITAGIFRGRRLVRKTKIPTRKYSEYERRLKDLVKSSGSRAECVGGIIISSVVPVSLARCRAALNRIFKCKICILGRDVKAPIRNLYKKKKEVGQDRLVNAFAARSLYGAPSVIIDFGTAITFDIVSRKGDYLGGLILPGIEISLQGLYEKTALLPSVRLKRTSHVIGRDTIDSIRGGILFGFGAMCDGLVAKYRKIFGKGTKVIATGGNAALISQYAKSIHRIDEGLTLKGLQLIKEKFF